MPPRPDPSLATLARDDIPTGLPRPARRHVISDFRPPVARVSVQGRAAGSGRSSGGGSGQRQRRRQRPRPSSIAAPPPEFEPQRHRGHRAAQSVTMEPSQSQPEAISLRAQEEPLWLLRALCVSVVQRAIMGLRGGAARMSTMVADDPGRCPGHCPGRWFLPRLLQLPTAAVTATVD